MKKTLIFIILGILVLLALGFFIYPKISGNATKMTNPKVLIQTSEGDIEVELYKDKAPITVENFLTYVNDGSYEDTVFHRVIKGFMIQGGGYTEKGQEKKTRAPIKLESNNGLKNEIGTIAMARTNDPNSATNQFFINTANNDFLNYGPRVDGYAVFGKVTKGLEVVRKIENSKTTVKYRMSDWPVNDVKIIKVKLLE